MRPLQRSQGRAAGGAFVGVLALSLAACSGDGEAGTTTAASSSAAAPSSTSSAAAATRPLQGKVILIDPGHNGGNATHPAEVNKLVDAGRGERKACNTTGTETNDGYPEHAQVWDVSVRLAAMLRQQGATVVLTRTNDTGVGPCVDVRGKAGAKAKADAALSIHADGNNSVGLRGFSVIHSDVMDGGPAVQVSSQKLAVAVRDAFKKGTGMPYSGYVGDGSGLTPRFDLGTLNLATVPTAMIESGNMRNPTDAALLKDPAFRQREAVALAAGIQAFLAR